MKAKCILAVIFVLCMMMTVGLCSAAAEKATSVMIGGVTLNDGQYMVNGAVSDTNPTTGDY